MQKSAMQKLRSHRFAGCKRLAGLALLCGLPGWAWAADLQVPATVAAGQAFTIPAEGSGQATFYLLGPGHVAKRTVSLGGEVQIESSDVLAAGRYQVILCGSPCASASFEVKAAQPAHLSFFLHPSRVPVSTPQSIDATAFVFDPYFNLVLSPAEVDFRVIPASGAGFSRRVAARHGVASIRMDSTPQEGAVHVTAAINHVEQARVVQQVAADACGLRMKALPGGNDTITVETDPVRDCSGNALPDGTVVSFTAIDKAGKSTVDTPIKKGIARAQLSVHGRAQITVACGVVLGNEVALNGKL
ncbi:MAG: hypothetical protein ACYDAE_28925 [Steroidobacteraceae bacterium]